MNPNSSYELLSFANVSDAKPMPGLYAWYLSMQMGKANTSSPENTARMLSKFAETISYPALTMEMQGHLSLRLKGDLKHIYYGHPEHKFSGLLEEVLQEAEGRSILNDIFELAVPLLTCPLYIGVSKNLKTRLNQHTQLIQTYQEEKVRQAAELANTIPVDDQEDLENDENFARRVAERNINPNNLLVGVIYPKGSGVMVRKAVEAAETLLNRIFHPILGRR